MRAIPVQVNGLEDQNRSSQLSRSHSQNVYLAPDPNGVWDWVSYDFYGCKSFLSRSLTNERGLAVFNDELYQVADNSLFKIALDGTSTELASGIAGSGRCIFEDDGVNLYFVTSGRYYKWGGVNLAQITANIGTPKSLTQLNSFFLLEQSATQFSASDAGAADTFNALAVGAANTCSDDIIRMITHDQLVYIIGEISTEVWYNSNQGELNFNRMEGTVVNIGTPATHSVAKDRNFIYLLGSDRSIYRIQGSTEAKISTKGIAREIEQMAKVNDAVGFTFSLEGQDFYYLTLPSGGKSYLFSATYEYWTTLSTGVLGGEYLARSYAFCYGKHFVADYRNASVYEWDDETYTDNGEARLRRRITKTITGAALGGSGNAMITAGSFYPEMEVGVGLTTGQGLNPQIMCSIAPDGVTFTNEQFVDIGISGDTYKKPSYDQFISGRRIALQIDITDPVKFILYGGHLELEDGGY